MALPPRDVDVLRLAAFTDEGRGGNPAGVVLDAEGLDSSGMQAIAAEVGYSETAFVCSSPSAAGDRHEYGVRYFTPTAEVPFCGHATIAAAIALARRDGAAPLLFHVASGRVPVDIGRNDDGDLVATLTSVAPWTAALSGADTADVLAALGWKPTELDPRLPPRLAYAGARHIVLAAATRERLAELDYDHGALGAVMRRLDAITVALLWREHTAVLHARNPAPAVGIVEDPATGAAAAAVGHYLVALGELRPPATVVVRQGADMGRPSRLDVEVDANRPEVRVSGVASELTAPAD